ncbi:GNAT family N-acetyltransferase [Streptomyces sp. NPDC087420]|uniref:GNAT family N-acetyltransferase n=1 Tax=Streptomyces sp. NPDC087420 TaxID=3365785 RepID=UPI003836C52A
MSVVESIHDSAPQFANSRDYYFGYGDKKRSDDPEFMIYRSHLMKPRRNGVLRYTRGGGGLDAAIARAHAELDPVPWLWWVGADSSAGLADQLLARGAAQVGVLPLMAAEIDRLAVPAAPPGVRVEEVNGPQELAAWVASYSPSFGLTPEQVTGNQANEAHRADEPGSLVRFAARLDGRVVGTSALLDRHGVAGVYVVSTEPACRGRGIGAFLTLVALRAGRERGLRIGTLQASVDGERLYSRMGFQTVAYYRQFQLPRF